MNTAETLRAAADHITALLAEEREPSRSEQFQSAEYLAGRRDAYLSAIDLININEGN